MILKLPRQVEPFHYRLKNYKNICLYLVSGLLLLSETSFSQLVLSRDHDLTQEHLIARVKQFDEFVKRFNYKIDFAGNPVDSSFMKLYPRDRYLDHLFNKELLFDSTGRQEYVIKFKDDVLRKNLILDKYSGDITAVAKVKVVYKNKPEYISISLKQEILEDRAVKWVIKDVSGKFMEMKKDDASKDRFLPPSSNETGFISLQRAMKDSIHLLAYTHEDFIYNQLSVFLYCIRESIIRIEHIENLSYVVKAIPGWSFTVEEFNRDTYNSGWLISGLEEDPKR